MKTKTQEAVLPYKPSASSAEGLKRCRDDFRIFGGWYSILKEKGKFKYSKDEILKKFLVPCLRELIKEGSTEFHPEKWKGTAREIYLDAFDIIVTKFRYLVAPHAEMIHKGRKTATVHARKFIQGSFQSIVGPEYEFGFARFENGKKISQKEFKTLLPQHHVSENERQEWWPEKKELYFYKIRTWIPMEKPRHVRVPKGTQTYGERARLNEAVTDQGMQRQKINSPTFAYMTVHGKEPKEFLRGRTDSPKKMWRNNDVDKSLKDKWLEDLNGIKEIEIRSTDAGKSAERIAFVVIRFKDEKNDPKAKSLSAKIAKEDGIFSGSDIGMGGRPRICVAGKIWEGQSGWEGWWGSLTGKIERNVEETLKEGIKEQAFDPEDYEPEKIKPMDQYELLKTEKNLAAIFEERGARESDELVINAYRFVKEELRRRGTEVEFHKELDRLTAAVAKGKVMDFLWEGIKKIQKLGPIVWKPKYISLTGSALFVDDKAKRMPNDLDTVFRDDNINTALLLKVDRIFEKYFGVTSHPIAEAFGPNWRNLALWDLALVPRREMIVEEIDEPGFVKEFYEAGEKGTGLQAQARASAREDEIKMNRYFFGMKPTKGYLKEEKMSLEGLMKFIKEEDYPILVEKKYDGAKLIVFKNGDTVTIYTDDGGNATNRLPKCISAIKKLKVKNAIFEVEAELWRDGKHLPRELMAGYLHEKGEPDDDDVMMNVYGILYKDGEDLHKKTEEERRAVLTGIKFGQNTNDKPNMKYQLNLVKSVVAKNAKELRSAVEDLRRRPGSEGVVIKKTGTRYYLNRSSKSGWYKLHNTAMLAGIVIEKIGTKTAGVYTYRYGIEPGKYKIRPGDLAEVKDKEYLEVGTTFSTNKSVERGGIIEIEFSTLNFVMDERADTMSITAWVPRFMRELQDRTEPDGVNEIVSRARREGILMVKRVKEDGKILYESAEVKEVEYLSLDEYKKFTEAYAGLTEEETEEILKLQSFFENFGESEKEEGEAEKKDIGFSKATKRVEVESRKRPRFWAVIQNHFRGESVSDLTPVIIKRKNGRIGVVPICSLFPNRFKGKEIQVNDGTMVWGGGKWEKMKWIMRHESSDRLLRINTYDGSVDVTKEHSLFQNGKMVESGRLKVGDSIDQVELPLIEGSKEVDREFARMVGFWIAEGSYRRGGEVSFTQMRKEPLERIKIWAEKYGLKCSISQDKLNGSYRMVMSGLQIFEQFYTRSPHEIETRKSRLKKIPSFVFEWDKKSKEAMLEGYLEGDGINIKGKHIEFATASQALAQGLILVAKVVYRDRIATIDLQENLFRIKLINPKNNRTKRERDEIKKILESKSRNSVGEANPHFKNGEFVKKMPFAKQSWTYSHKRYVYDIETESHSFQAGVGKILAHNSQHKDFRTKMNGYLKGWTITDQPEGKITEPVKTIEDGRRITKEVKFKFSPDMDPTTHCVAIAKAKEPLAWLGFDDVGVGKYAAVPPGGVGATKFEWGVFTRVDSGYAYLTIKKPFFEEYFLNMKDYKGRMVIRLIPVGIEWKKPPKKRLQWQTWMNLKDQTPYLLSRRARVKADYIPDESRTTASGLPPDWEKKIPIAMRWWIGKLSRKEKFDKMDEAYNYLIEKKILKGHKLKESESKKVKYVVRRNWWKGAVIVRGMPVQHWELVIDSGKDYLDEFRLESDPLIKEKLERGIPAVHRKVTGKTPKGGGFREWMKFEGEIPPNHSEWGNPNKKIPAYKKIIDKGEADWIEESAMFHSFDFGSGGLSGAVVIIRESPDANIWVMKKGKSPGEER